MIAKVVVTSKLVLKSLEITRKLAVCVSRKPLTEMKPGDATRLSRIIESIGAWPKNLKRLENPTRVENLSKRVGRLMLGGAASHQVQSMPKAMGGGTTRTPDLVPGPRGPGFIPGAHRAVNHSLRAPQGRAVNHSLRAPQGDRSYESPPHRPQLAAALVAGPGAELREHVGGH